MFKYQSPAVEKAEREIAKVFASLETETGCIVKSIELTSKECTNINSTAQEMLMAVSVEIERPPGHHWRTESNQ